MLLPARYSWFFHQKDIQDKLVDVEWLQCPRDPDATAEAYLTGGLPQQQIVAYEEHYLGCPRCSERLQFTEEFVLAFRRAAERLRFDRRHTGHRG